MNQLKKIIRIIGPVIILLLLATAYFPAVLNGKQLSQHDTVAWKGMSKELVDYRAETKTEGLWTNSMFGGMPGYMISVNYPYNLVTIFQSITYKILSTSIFCLFLYLIAFYILLKTLKFNVFLSIAGAIAFGFSSYFLIIIAAGHTSKAMALGYLPMVIAGVLMAFRRKPLEGGLLFAVALSFEILAGHLQITYYGFLFLALYILVQLIYSWKANELAAFGKALLFLAAGAVIAVGMNFSRLYTTYEYSKETIRGKSELTTNDANKTTGLDKDYVVQWSYGIDETLTLLIPNFKGGSSLTNPGVSSESFKTLQQKGVQNPRQTIQAVSMYHGDQPGTSGPVYVGAIVVFLFVLGLFVVTGPCKWWLLLATVVSVVLSWGGNVMGITSFLLDYLPFYNKFRAPSMTLVIAQTAMPLLGFIALNNILTGKITKTVWLNGLKWSALITGGIALIFAALPAVAGDFTNATDAMRFPDWLMDSVIADRKNLLRADAFRSFVFIALAAGAVYLWHIQKLKTNLFIGILGVLILVDLWAVDKRYLNDSNFKPKKEVEVPFPETVADREILKDKDISYRVLPLQDPFQDARTSYYHQNVGGYHAAKLRRYQEMIENQLAPEMQQMVQGLQAGQQPDSVFSQLSVINMLNARYIIYDVNSAPLRNPDAMGNAWFVGSYRMAENADEEMATLKEIDPSEEAVIDQRFSGFVEGKTFQKDENGKIVLTECQPNYLKYEVETGSEQLAVFSEIYYDKGWNAYIDGEKSSHFRANYILRSMVIPAGKHIVEFKFEPKSYFIGNKISLASSLLLILAVAGYAFSEFRKRKMQP